MNINARVKSRTEIIINKLNQQYGDIDKLPHPLINFYALRETLDFVPDKVLHDAARKVIYSEYLKSPYWKAIRQYLIYTKRQCNICKSSYNLTVHHKTYEHVGYEYKHLEDLQVVCYKCHRKYHTKYGEIKGYYTIQEILKTTFQSINEG